MKLSNKKTPPRKPVSIERKQEISDYWRKEKDNRISVLAKHFNEPEWVILSSVDWYLNALKPHFKNEID